MKILQVTNFFSPIHGGSVAPPYYLSKELVKRGHTVAIYTSDFKLSHDYIDSIPEIKVRYFKTWLSLAKFYITPSIIRSAREDIKRFDVIHMHNYRTFQNIVVHYYAKKHGIPYILQAHGSLTTFFQRRGLKRTFDTIWGYRLLRDASRLIGVTEMEVEHYQQMGVSRDKIETVPNGISLSEFNDLPQKGEFRGKYNLNERERLILFLGRIDKVKGLDLLAEAFAKLSQTLANIRLVITGPDDGYLFSLKKMVANLGINDRVLFTGPLYGREKLEAFVDADVYVLPSAYEIFGVTLLEALACSTPVITSDRCGIADVIDGQAGLVVPYDKESLKQALLSILSDEKIRLEFGGKGKLLVREKFSWDKIAEQVEQLYKDILRVPRLPVQERG